MILRYGIELTTRPSFTASQDVDSEEEAEKKIAWMKKSNSVSNRMKYFNAVLYTDSNEVIKKYTL